MYVCIGKDIIYTFLPPSECMTLAYVFIYLYIVIFVECVFLCERVCVFVCVCMYRSS